MLACLLLVASAVLHPTLHHGAVASRPRGLLRIQSEPWPDAPGGGRKNAYLLARIPSCTEAIGSCGLEVLKMSKDGLYDFDDDSNKSVRPRAVLSGTLYVNERFRRQGVAQHLLTAAEGTARWWGVDEMILIVKAKNKVAQNLYRKVRRCPTNFQAM